MTSLTRRTMFVGLLAGLFLHTGAAQAGPIDIFEFSVYMNSTETGGASLRDTAIGLGPTTFTAGFDVSFANNLDADNVGTMTWSMTNNTGSDLTNVSLFGFLDAEIDETINSFFNEFGTTSDLNLGSGAGDGLADSFEIDEPGFVFGDIIANLFGGALDNTNSLQPALSDDVSMALGFEIGSLLVGQTLTATFDISLIANGGLGHVDPNSNFQFWYNGFVEVTDPDPTPVPAPATLWLVMLGGVLLAGARRLRRAIPWVAGFFSLAFAGSTLAGGGDPIVDENPPVCNCFSKGPSDEASRDYDSFDIFFDSFVFCSISDSRPTEDVNGNGVLDPGEDLNGNGFIDDDTGIFDVSLAPGSINAELFVFFDPGDPFVFADISTDAFDAPATFTLQATDGAGNMCQPAVQLEPFDPTGGLDFFPSITVNIPIPVPPNPSNPPTGVACVDIDPGDEPTPDFFVGQPFTPIGGNPTIIPDYTFASDGDRQLCCVFETQDGSVSPPLCAFPFIEPSTQPLPPEDLFGRPKPSKIDLFWPPVDDADEYIVLRGEGPIGVTLEPIATTTSTLYVDFDAAPAVIYTYAVQTVRDGETSEISKELEVFIPAIRGGSGKGPKGKK